MAKPAKSGSKSGLFAKGPDPRRGRGPKPGTGGRPPNEFKSFLKNEIRDAVASRDALAKAAADTESRNFGTAWKIATDYDDDKPAQRIQVSIDRIREMSDAELEAIVAGKKR